MSQLLLLLLYNYLTMTITSFLLRVKLETTADHRLMVILLFFWGGGVKLSLLMNRLQFIVNYANV